MLGQVQYQATTKNLSELLDHVNDIMSNFDYVKAFDKVNHSLLIQKLNRYGINQSLFNWITSFLSDRTHTVTVNGIHSIIAKIISGYCKEQFFVLFCS